MEEIALELPGNQQLHINFWYRKDVCRMIFHAMGHGCCGSFFVEMNATPIPSAYLTSCRRGGRKLQKDGVGVGGRVSAFPVF